MPKVSVIIPVYGVEKYIERCARSLFEQTLDDIEYLFIDDCTPDRSIEVLRRTLENFPSRKSQVIIHTMERNSGQAAVRKWGVQNAKGEYIIHCDSDDWVDTKMYETMYESAVKEEADAVITDYFITDGKNNCKPYKGCVDSDSSRIMDDILGQEIHGALWNKLFKRCCYDGTIFPNGNLCEDIAYCVQLLPKCKRITYLNIPLYYYYSNIHAITKQFSYEKNISNFNNLVANIRLIERLLSEEKYEGKYSKEILNLKFNSLLYLFPYVDKNVVYQLLRNTYPENFNDFLFSTNTNLFNKLKYVLSIIRVYPYINRILKRE